MQVERRQCDWGCAPLPQVGLVLQRTRTLQRTHLVSDDAAVKAGSHPTSGWLAYAGDAVLAALPGFLCLVVFNPPRYSGCVHAKYTLTCNI